MGGYWPAGCPPHEGTPGRGAAPQRPGAGRCEERRGEEMGESWMEVECWCVGKERREKKGQRSRKRKTESLPCRLLCPRRGGKAGRKEQSEGKGTSGSWLKLRESVRREVTGRSGQAVRRFELKSSVSRLPGSVRGEKRNTKATVQRLGLRAQLESGNPKERGGKEALLRAAREGRAERWRSDRERMRPLGPASLIRRSAVC